MAENLRGQSQSTPDSSVVITDIATGWSMRANKTIADPTDRFRPVDSLYVSVRTQGAAPRATLVVSEAEQGIVPKGSTITEFHIRKPDGSPSGEYQVTVTLNNGVSKATKTKGALRGDATVDHCLKRDDEDNAGQTRKQGT